MSSDVTGLLLTGAALGVVSGIWAGIAAHNRYVGFAVVLGLFAIMEFLIAAGKIAAGK